MIELKESKNVAKLARRAHMDLTVRARGGIVIYVLGWLALTLPIGIHESHSIFFTINTVILVLIMAARLVHLFMLPTDTDEDVQKTKRVLVLFALAGSLHWGLLTAWVMMSESFGRLDYNLIASAAVLGIAGTTALSIDNTLRIYFPKLILLPVIAAFVWRGSTDDLMLATMALLALGYVTITAKTTHTDYWHAISNEALAQQRATALEELSVTDQLTQLKNRSYFDHRFLDEWKRGDRQQTFLSLLMLDLDHFKRLNDTYGHVFGDEVLRNVAAVMRDQLFRESDLVARYGGEEFVILLPHTDEEGARLVAERLRTAVQDMVMSHKTTQVPVTCSIGGATALPDHKTDRVTLLKLADAALYASKDDGRNRYSSCSGLLSAKNVKNIKVATIQAI